MNDKFSSNQRNFSEKSLFMGESSKALLQVLEKNEYLQLKICSLNSQNKTSILR